MIVVRENPRADFLNLTNEEEWECPIVYSEMVDPVTDSAGHSYERDSIQEVMKCNAIKDWQTGAVIGYKSPITRATITEVVISNRYLKAVISAKREHRQLWICPITGSKIVDPVL